VKLSECIDELRTNLLHDNAVAYWSDATLVRYIDEAQRRFARRALCIADDTTPEVTRVTLVANQPVYVLHESVLRVKSARHQDSTQDMLRITHPISFARWNPQTDPVDFFVRSDLATNFDNATYTATFPQEYATDEGVQVGDRHQVRMLMRPTPVANQTDKVVFLRVLRLPLSKLQLAHLNASLEIPEDWGMDMLEWAAYRALRNWDGDAGEGGGQVEEWVKAEKHKARFEEAVKECKAEIANKLEQPPTWAFGQGGFSYIHN
jgi:hypothetical protein